MKNTKTTIRDFFQTEYLDTKRIKESFIQKWQGKTHGRSPDGVQYVTVGDLTFDYNSRRPKATTIMKYIEDSKGLDWHLFGSCQIAKVEETFDLWEQSQTIGC